MAFLSIHICAVMCLPLWMEGWKKRKFFICLDNKSYPTFIQYNLYHIHTFWSNMKPLLVTTTTYQYVFCVIKVDKRHDIETEKADKTKKNWHILELLWLLLRSFWGIKHDYVKYYTSVELFLKKKKQKQWRKWDKSEWTEFLYIGVILSSFVRHGRERRENKKWLKNF